MSTHPTLLDAILNEMLDPDPKEAARLEQVVVSWLNAHAPTTGHPSVARLLLRNKALESAVRILEDDHKLIAKSAEYWHLRFDKYARHLADCSMRRGGDTCTCGFIDYTVRAEAGPQYGEKETV